MDNTLSKYMGVELKAAIDSLSVVSGTARDSGNTYYAVEISFINGYKKRIFLKSDEAFAWTNAFELLKTQSIVDNNL